MDNIRRSSCVMGGRISEFIHIRWIHSPSPVDRLGGTGDPNHPGTKNGLIVHDHRR